MVEQTRREFFKTLLVGAALTVLPIQQLGRYSKSKSVLEKHAEDIEFTLFYGMNVKRVPTMFGDIMIIDRN